MNLASKQLCPGCTACYAVCPVSAIVMQEDREGFSYPEIDSGKCTNCGCCERVCPVLHPAPTHEPLAVYAAKNKDDTIRMQSSSGGIFTLLAQQILKAGGIVFGAGWSPDWRVVHKSVETEEELADLRGSKYVQSDMGDTFKQVKGILESKRKVLFSGTPCQIAGLKHYLHYSKLHQHLYNECLLSVDLICGAVPSPRVFDLYKKNKERQYHGKVKRIFFRDKTFGWKKFSLSLMFDNGIKHREDVCTDNYLRGFISQLFNRPACSNCPCRQLKSSADITIADYWNVQQKFSDFDDNKGTSIIMANTLSGVCIVQNILPVCEYVQSDFADVKITNPPVWRSYQPHQKRQVFFRKLGDENIETLIDRMLKPSLYRRLRSLAGRIKRKIGEMG